MSSVLVTKVKGSHTLHWLISVEVCTFLKWFILLALCTMKEMNKFSGGGICEQSTSARKPRLDKFTTQGQQLLLV